MKGDLLQRRPIIKETYFKGDLLQRRPIIKETYYKGDLLQRRPIIIKTIPPVAIVPPPYNKEPKQSDPRVSVFMAT